MLPTRKFDIGGLPEDATARLREPGPPVQLGERGGPLGYAAAPPREASRASQRLAYEESTRISSRF